MTWTIEVNERLKRVAVHEKYGGQRMGGISTPSDSENILIFTDPRAGAEFGYDKHEGQTPDGNYRYTGAGQVGPMKMTGVNKVILDSVKTGKVLRLFLAESPWVTYKGSFTLAETPYDLEIAPDVNGDPREVIVFNLTPLNASLENMPVLGSIRHTVANEQKEWAAPNWESFVAIRKARGEQQSEISRSEHKLQADFGNWLVSQGHRLIDMSFETAGVRIYPDLFDETSMTVFEAKRSSGRIYVRTAIGQVLDYKHVARKHNWDVKSAILLPGRPAEDLISLCIELGISIYIRSDGGQEKPSFLEIC